MRTCLTRWQEALAGRYARRVVCEGGSFVGPQGEVRVRATGGAWAVRPSGRDGASAVRFYLDFPDGAERNDVSLPAGRVYMSCACYEGTSLTAVEEAAIAADGLALIDAPNGLRLLSKGGLTIKRNGLRNLYGALGDVYFILGKAGYAPSPTTEERAGGS